MTPTLPSGLTVHDVAGLPSDIRYELLEGKLLLSSPFEFVSWLSRRLADAGTVYVVDEPSLSVIQPGDPAPEVVVVHVDLDLDLDLQDWTVGDLEDLHPDLRYELVGGRLLLLRPTPAHQMAVMDVIVPLSLVCPRGFFAVHGVALEFDDHNELRPSGVVMSRRYGRQTPVPTVGVLLVLEVVSPDSRYRDLYAKTVLYAAAGIKHLWLLDPLHPDGFQLTQYRLGNGSYVEVCGTREVFTAAEPFPVTLDLPAMTARWNEDMG